MKRLLLALAILVGSALFGHTASAWPYNCPSKQSGRYAAAWCWSGDSTDGHRIAVSVLHPNGWRYTAYGPWVARGHKSEIVVLSGHAIKSRWVDKRECCVGGF